MHNPYVPFQANDRLARPRRVTFLAMGVFIMAVVYGLRFTGVLQQWDFLAALLPFSPLYLALTGLVWCLGGLVLAWGLWTGRRWAPRAARIGLLLYFGFYWWDRMLVGDAGSQRGNSLFILIVMVIALCLVFWMLTRAQVQHFFGERHDNQPKNSSTS